MKRLLFCMILLLIPSVLLAGINALKFYSGQDERLLYVGRADFSSPEGPKMWASGAYVELDFKGSEVEVLIGDEIIYGTVHNYIEVQIDDQPSFRLQLTEANNRLVLAKGLTWGKHRLRIFKNTEFENGYIQFKGFYCAELLAKPNALKRKIEFIGDSITCGFGADETLMKCSDPKSTWYDQHSAYYAYGPRVARALNAQYHLSSVSGIGLIHSCCDKKIVMPDVFDKVNMSKNELSWDFNKFQPDVVSICLGQNDGVQDSAKFVSAYIQFVQRLRGYYPKTQFVLLTSPMADEKLKTFMTSAIKAVANNLAQRGEKRVSTYVFKKRSISGCSAHPSRAEQAEIAEELQVFLKNEMKW